ncbi:hypothetical protein GY45DRAFT_17835 [Cubamyces sp. BRFM 1775]|nr:hypothetical protein GY45DRAFT_17835 [Cubamyces sp. BRFM 1775]
MFAGSPHRTLNAGRWARGAGRGARGAGRWGMRPGACGKGSRVGARGPRAGIRGAPRSRMWRRTGTGERCQRPRRAQASGLRPYALDPGLGTHDRPRNSACRVENARCCCCCCCWVRQPRVRIRLVFSLSEPPAAVPSLLHPFTHPPTHTLHAPSLARLRPGPGNFEVEVDSKRRKRARRERRWASGVFGKDAREGSHGPWSGGRTAPAGRTGRACGRRAVGRGPWVGHWRARGRRGTTSCALAGLLISTVAWRAGARPRGETCRAAGRRADASIKYNGLNGYGNRADRAL